MNEMEIHRETGGCMAACHLSDFGIESEHVDKDIVDYRNDSENVTVWIRLYYKSGRHMHMEEVSDKSGRDEIGCTGL